MDDPTSPRIPVISIIDVARTPEVTQIKVKAVKKPSRYAVSDDERTPPAVARAAMIELNTPLPPSPLMSLLDDEDETSQAESGDESDVTDRPTIRKDIRVKEDESDREKEKKATMMFVDDVFGDDQNAVST